MQIKIQAVLVTVRGHMHIPKPLPVGWEEPLLQPACPTLVLMYLAGYCLHQMLKTHLGPSTVCGKPVRRLWDGLSTVRSCLESHNITYVDTWSWIAHNSLKITIQTYNVFSAVVEQVGLQSRVAGNTRTHPVHFRLRMTTFAVTKAIMNENFAASTIARNQTGVHFFRNSINKYKFTAKPNRKRTDMWRHEHVGCLGLFRVLGYLQPARAQKSSFHFLHRVLDNLFNK